MIPNRIGKQGSTLNGSTNILIEIIIYGIFKISTTSRKLSTAYTFSLLPPPMAKSLSVFIFLQAPTTLTSIPSSRKILDN